MRGIDVVALVFLLVETTQGLGQAIENDRQNHHAQAADKTFADVELRDAFEHHIAQATRADHRGDDHHRKAEHDALIDPGHDGRKSRGNLDLGEQLPPGGAERLRGFDQFVRNLPDAQRGQADEGRQREDGGGDYPGHQSQTEEDDGRHQVYEGRHGLHDVEHGPQRLFKQPAFGAQNAGGHADEDDQHLGGQHQRQGLDQIVPVAEVPHQTQPQNAENRQRPAARTFPSHGSQSEYGHQRDEDRHGYPGQSGLQSGDEKVDGVGDGVEGGRVTVGQVVDAVADPVANGNRLSKCHQEFSLKVPHRAKLRLSARQWSANSRAGKRSRGQ